MIRKLATFLLSTPTLAVIELVALNSFAPRIILAAGMVGNGMPDTCFEAMLDNALAGGGSVTFDCGPSPVMITITSTKVISADTTIDGGGLITISGGDAVGVFSVSSGVNFAIQNLTIANGLTTTRGGGAICNHGTLTVTNSTLSGNFVLPTNNGGGIYSAGGPVAITNSTLFNNDAGSGGGIYNNGGTLTVTNSTFSLNSAYDVGNNGGGIANDNGGTLIVTNSTFENNHSFSDNGGGIANDNGGTLTVTNSTFSGNGADSNGGGISNGSGGTLTITNSTFSRNYDFAYNLNGGGAIYSNEAGTLVTITNTVVAYSPALDNCRGPIVDGGHNIDNSASCGFSTTNGSLNNTDPKLDALDLQNNGGPTKTIALRAGSPAISAADESVCAAPPVSNLDQRGFVRPGAGATKCSIGAYEFNSGPACGSGLCVFPEVCTDGQCAPLTATPTNTPTLDPNNTPTPTCIGDCNGSGTVTVDDMLAMVNVALGNAPCSHCVAAHCPITVDQVLAALNNALNGCPA